MEQKKTTYCTLNYIASKILMANLIILMQQIYGHLALLFILSIETPSFETQDITTYKKIKVCQYTFPDHVVISNNAKNVNYRSKQKSYFSYNLYHSLMTSNSIFKNLLIFQLQLVHFLCHRLKYQLTQTFQIKTT
ncbi:unnamed protein product [Paramecium sonneborni]|uniref:Transmembrane protein n=1 Tax=Paramecium sonneborni TaxID=65129 RepID=A0A8S1RBV5_9CILI|nr:unnamed protein product [Paramecium sonneborni]